MHANARLTPIGRATLIERILQGRPVAHVAAEMGISRATAYKWWARFRHESWAGLTDRSSRPARCPHRTPQDLERRIEALRRRHKLGPARIGWRLDMAPSTVHAVLVRQGLNRLAWLDRPTGRVIRRIEHTRPGELVQVDVKKLGRIPAGGGWRAHGWGNVARTKSRRVGYAYVHSAIDSYSRVAYSEVLDDETALTAIGFVERTHSAFATYGITIECIQTDNGSCYRAHRFRDTVEALGATHHRIPPRRPAINGKVERFHRTLADNWAYVRVYRSDRQRNQALDPWLHLYNYHRAHTSLGGQPPMSRLSNLPGHNT